MGICVYASEYHCREINMSAIYVCQIEDVELPSSWQMQETEHIQHIVIFSSYSYKLFLNKFYLSCFLSQYLAIWMPFP